MFIPMSQGMWVMSHTYYHLGPSHKGYVMKSVTLCNSIASLSSFASEENTLFLWKVNLKIWGMGGVRQVEKWMLILDYLEASKYFYEALVLSVYYFVKMKLAK